MKRLGGMFIGWFATTIMIQGILVTTYFPSILLISPSIYFSDLRLTVKISENKKNAKITRYTVYWEKRYFIAAVIINPLLKFV